MVTSPRDKSKSKKLQIDRYPTESSTISKYHVNNCRKWAGRISRDHTLQFAGKKGMTASMGSETSGNGPGERTSL